MSAFGIAIWEDDCVEAPYFYYLTAGLDKVKC